MTKNKEHNKNLNNPISFEGVNKRNIYDVPKNYFEFLQESIEEKIIEADLSDLSISKRNIYETPNQYISSFKTLDQKTEPTRIISFKNFNSNRFLKIAATVTLIIGLGYLSFLFLDNSKTNNNQISNTNDFDFEISEYETGLFNETEDELMASLIFEEDISFDNSDLINESDLTIDELEEYLESDIDLSIEF